jgi:type IV pilus assembly protein PilB
MHDLGQLLCEQSIFTGDDLKMIALQACEQKQSFASQCLEFEGVDSSALLSVLSQHFAFPRIDLSACDLSILILQECHHDCLSGLPLLILSESDLYIAIAVADPTLPILYDLPKILNKDVHVVLASRRALDEKIQAVSKHQQGGMDDFMRDDDDDFEDFNDLDISSYTGADDVSAADIDVNDTPVVKFVNKVLMDAIRSSSSDIHIEPYEKTYRVRYRQDGILHEVAKPPLKLSSAIVARLKVMSNLDISERRVPQDGRFKLHLSKRKSIDFRISTCPTLYGEKVVMRILDSSDALLGTEELGFEEGQTRIFLEQVKASHGMILVTGPTGSGKTVTLYNALGMLNDTEKNISTIEDPVEINMEGVNQVPVNIKTGMTFAGALRSFLRQDPDIIMLGEIRDLETAEIAVKAAQTGHLVLSTLHTNSAPETITRMLNMGVASFNIASSVNVVIAQRLVRRLCQKCKKKRDIPDKALLEAGFTASQIKEGIDVYEPNGCVHCSHGKGYKGRMGIYEVMPINRDMGRLIMDGGNALQIAEFAEKQGMISLRTSGLNKVKLGLTTLAEVNRVVTL